MADHDEPAPVWRPFDPDKPAPLRYLARHTVIDGVTYDVMTNKAESRVAVYRIPSGDAPVWHRATFSTVAAANQYLAALVT